MKFGACLFLNCCVGSSIRVRQPDVSLMDGGQVHWNGAVGAEAGDVDGAAVDDEDGMEAVDGSVGWNQIPGGGNPCKVDPASRLQGKQSVMNWFSAGAHPGFHVISIDSNV